MHRYEELERLYYKKLFFKIFLIFLLVIILIGIVAFIYFKSFEKKPKEVKKTIIKKTKIVPKKIEKKEEKKEKEVKTVSFILPEVKENIQNSKQFNKEVNKSKETKKISKDIIEEKKVNAGYLIKKFKQTPALDLALMIANEYLKENNLSEAKNWALKANSINPQDERSWLIFSDILVKEGEIKKAKEILNFYIDSYGKNDKIENKLRSLNAK